jgi:mRNA interferase RelE/StbE
MPGVGRQPLGGGLVGRQWRGHGGEAIGGAGPQGLLEAGGVLPVRCSLRIKRSAAKALAALPKADRVRVVDAIDRLCDMPAAGSALKGEFEGLRRLRVGPYRVVYESRQRELVILVVRTGHRREVYR